MPTFHFICPNGQAVKISDCLNFCPNGQRCMFLPTLRAVAKSLDRKISKPTVTELIAGVRETFLKKTSNYSVDLASILYVLQGQAIHSINELQFDLFGKILDTDDGVKDLLDWTIQLNYYRMLLEKPGYERGIDKPVYIIPINKISDCWLNKYFNYKAKLLRDAIISNTLPPICSPRERWHDKKCLNYCAARQNCPLFQKISKEGVFDEQSLSA